MLSAPDPYPAVSTQNPAPDDAQIESKTPEICVDYLSHDWKDEDVWNSWKAMTKRKNEISNGLRLENASWRTWAKQRGKLKTVSPETLNWLKESDVTWLYGPLHGEAKPVPPPKVATTAERLGIDDHSGKKSILKHRTLTDLLQQPRTLSLANEEEPEDAWSKKSELHTVRSEVHLARPTDLRRRLGSPELERGDAAEAAEAKARRHISFNHRVEQCVALDYSGVSSEEETSASEASDASSDAAPSSRRSSTASSEPPASIARLEPTQLKTPHEFHLQTSPVTHMSGFIDSDDDSYDDEDARYSVADPVPVTQDLALDQDGYDYYASDEEYDGASAPYVQSVSNTASGVSSATHANPPPPVSAHDTRLDPVDPPPDPTPADGPRGRTPQRVPRGGDRKIPRAAGAPPSVPHEPLVVDVANLPSPSLEESAAASAERDQARSEDRRAAASLGPTPQNTPDGPIAGYARRTDAPTDGARPSGALVAPPAGSPAVPLADDYVEAADGGLIAGAVEILNTARDLIGTLMGSSGPGGRPWYE
ncbi:protein phosphatase regulator [Malassezia brasiliensis]|uniref:Protein phosphatase regulator n=1 Tax=Malassezia brasiliensis TaxID=1821822 RepID=A0AAF0IR54_9BASI|nr:protein phosphatase regulator [Malassezia brasiliensis]